MKSLLFNIFFVFISFASFSQIGTGGGIGGSIQTPEGEYLPSCDTIDLGKIVYQKFLNGKDCGCFEWKDEEFQEIETGCKNIIPGKCEIEYFNECCVIWLTDIEYDNSAIDKECGFINGVGNEAINMFWGLWEYEAVMYQNNNVLYPNVQIEHCSWNENFITSMIPVANDNFPDRFYFFNAGKKSWRITKTVSCGLTAQFYGPIRATYLENTCGKPGWSKHVGKTIDLMPTFRRADKPTEFLKCYKKVNGKIVNVEYTKTDGTPIEDFIQFLADQNGKTKNELLNYKSTDKEWIDCAERCGFDFGELPKFESNCYTVQKEICVFNTEPPTQIWLNRSYCEGNIIATDYYSNDITVLESDEWEEYTGEVSDVKNCDGSEEILDEQDFETLSTFSGCAKEELTIGWNLDGPECLFDEQNPVPAIGSEVCYTFEDFLEENCELIIPMQQSLSSVSGNTVCWIYDGTNLGPVITYDLISLTGDYIQSGKTETCLGGGGDEFKKVEVEVCQVLCVGEDKVIRNLNGEVIEKEDLCFSDCSGNYNSIYGSWNNSAWCYDEKPVLEFVYNDGSVAYYSEGIKLKNVELSICGSCCEDEGEEEPTEDPCVFIRCPEGTTPTPNDEGGCDCLVEEFGDSKTCAATKIGATFFSSAPGSGTQQGDIFLGGNLLGWGGFFEVVDSAGDTHIFNKDDTVTGLSSGQTQSVTLKGWINWSDGRTEYQCNVEVLISANFNVI